MTILNKHKKSKYYYLIQNIGKQHSKKNNLKLVKKGAIKLPIKKIENNN